MSVPTFTPVVHLVSDFEYLPDSVLRQMCASLHQSRDLLELCKVSLLLSRQEREPLEERDHVLDDGVEVRHLVIPNAVRPATKSSAAQVPFEESEDDSILLRYVEADGDLPRHYVIRPRSEGDIEAPLAVREACQVVAYFR